MPNRKRKVVLHRIAKTETRVYNQPVREVVRDIQVILEPPGEWIKPIWMGERRKASFRTQGWTHLLGSSATQS